MYGFKTSFQVVHFQNVMHTYDDTLILSKTLLLCPMLLKYLGLF